MSVKEEKNKSIALGWGQMMALQRLVSRLLIATHERKQFCEIRQIVESMDADFDSVFNGFLSDNPEGALIMMNEIASVRSGFIQALDGVNELLLEIESGKIQLPERPARMGFLNLIHREE